MYARVFSTHASAPDAATDAPCCTSVAPCSNSNCWYLLSSSCCCRCRWRCSCWMCLPPHPQLAGTSCMMQHAVQSSTGALRFCRACCSCWGTATSMSTGGRCARNLLPIAKPRLNSENQILGGMFAADDKALYHSLCLMLMQFNNTSEACIVPATIIIIVIPGIMTSSTAIV